MNEQRGLLLFNYHGFEDGDIVAYVKSRQEDEVMNAIGNIWAAGITVDDKLSAAFERNTANPSNSRTMGYMKTFINKQGKAHYGKEFDEADIEKFIKKK